MPTGTEGVLSSALAGVKAYGQYTVDLVARLVELNSFTENIEGVNRVGEVLAQTPGLATLSLERIRGQRFADHLVWRTPAALDRPEARVVIVGHHDTVFPPGTYEGWRQSGDFGYGPGAFDMKGGLAVIAAGLAVLAKVGVLSGIPLVVISVSDEEVGSPESAEHITSIARGARCGLVFESGRPGDNIVTRRRGFAAYDAIATGRPAHAGNDHANGINAIWALARFVDAAQQLTNYEDGVTVNVGVISGGQARNSVPAHARCSLDGRFETSEGAERVVSGLSRAATIASDGVGADIKLEGGILRPPLQPDQRTAALLAAYGACQRRAGLGAGEAAIAGGGSDANTLGAVGVPVIDGLGPRGSGYHTNEERIEIRSLAPKTEALVRFLLSAGSLE